MKVFITGTDTNIGKTLISAWICMHTNYAYWKPIQAGILPQTDTEYIKKITQCKTYKESYVFNAALSPHLAAKFENTKINIDNIIPPQSSNIIIEGAGGVLVPITNNHYMLDLIKYLNANVILVARSNLGTINHTLLTINALKNIGINLLGIIMNGEKNLENKKAIEYYGKAKVLHEFPHINSLNMNDLSDIGNFLANESFSDPLKDIFSK